MQDSVAPAQVEAVEPGHYFFDFGRDAYAALQLTLTCPAACTVVVHMGERRDGPRHIDRTPGGSVRYYTVRVPLAAGPQTVTVPLGARDGRMMPPSVGPVMPYRYVEIESLPAPPGPRACVQRATHSPFDDHDAAFTSSDAALVRVWDLCRYTMKATSFCGIFVDGDRERHPYEADAYINQLGYYYATREFGLPRYSHESLIQHPTWPTEWGLHSVFMAWADYLHTGDATSMAAFYEDLQAKTLFGLRRDDGLITSADMPPDVLKAIRGDPRRDIVDWPAHDRDGYVMLPVNTVVNAFHYRALVLMRRISAALGRTADAARFREAARTTYDTLNAKLFDEATGLYVDGEGAAHSALHANMFPLAFGLVPAERMPAVASFVRGRGMACSVYGAQYLLEACYASGMADHALALLTATSNRGWMHMINDVGTTIALEAWDDADKPNEDWNHAWGAAPANVIPRLLMGIEPIEPGFRRVRLRPQPGPLARARITVPTIRGPITVAIGQDSHGFRLDATLPANMEGEVWLPAPGKAPGTVRVNGHDVSRRTVGDFIVIDRIGSGKSLITMR